jgi:hypothetical protein
MRGLLLRRVGLMHGRCRFFLRFLLYGRLRFVHGRRGRWLRSGRVLHGRWCLYWWRCFYWRLNGLLRVRE